MSAAREFPVPEIDCGVVGWVDTRRRAIRARQVVGRQRSVIRHKVVDGAAICDAREPFSLLSIISWVCHRESPAGAIVFQLAYFVCGMRGTAASVLWPRAYARLRGESDNS